MTPSRIARACRRRVSRPGKTGSLRAAAVGFPPDDAAHHPHLHHLLDLHRRAGHDHGAAGVLGAGRASLHAGDQRDDQPARRRRVEPLPLVHPEHRRRTLLPGDRRPHLPAGDHLVGASLSREAGPLLVERQPRAEVAGGGHPAAGSDAAAGRPGARRDRPVRRAHRPRDHAHRHAGGQPPGKRPPGIGQGGRAAADPPRRVPPRVPGDRAQPLRLPRNRPAGGSAVAVGGDGHQRDRSSAFSTTSSTTRCASPTPADASCCGSAIATTRPKSSSPTTASASPRPS